MNFRWRRYQHRHGPPAWALLFRGDRIGEVRPVNRNLCPFCWGVCEAEFVDVGVGGQGVQVTPYECTVCGAREARWDDDKGKEVPGWDPGPCTLPPDVMLKEDVVYAGYVPKLVLGVIKPGEPNLRDLRRAVLGLVISQMTERVERACLAMSEDWA